MRYEYFVSQHPFNGNVEIIRVHNLFWKLKTRRVVARYHYNDEGFELAYRHCAHLNRWFEDGWWSNTTWL